MKPHTHTHTHIIINLLILLLLTFHGFGQQFSSKTDVLLGVQHFEVQKLETSPQLHYKAASQNYQSLFAKDPLSTTWNVKVETSFPLFYFLDSFRCFRHWDNDYYEIYYQNSMTKDSKSFLMKEDLESGKAWIFDFDGLFENLIYDMSLKVGDTFYIDKNGIIADSVYYENSRKHIRFNYHLRGRPQNPKFTMIEGVGTNCGISYHKNFPQGGQDPLLLCQSKDEQLNFVTDFSIFNGLCNVSTLSVDETPQTDHGGMKIYPNPAQLEFNVVQPYGLQNSYLIIRDMLGKALITMKLTDRSTKISTKHLPYGLYLVSLYNGSILVGSSKVVIKK